MAKIYDFDPENKFSTAIEILMDLFKSSNNDLLPYKTRTAMRYFISLDPCNLPEKYDFLQDLVNKILKDAEKTAIDIGGDNKFIPIQLFVNYYRDGSDSCAMHKHPCRQLTVSFGSTRSMKVNSKSFELKNGSAIFLHGQKHGIPKEIGVVGKIITDFSNNADSQKTKDQRRISFNLFFTTSKEMQGPNA